MHVYGEASDALRSACAAVALPIEVFAWSAGARSARLQRNAGYVVRPDGYVALVIAPDDDAGELTCYAGRFGLRFGGVRNAAA
jgi:hypothetical protein